MCGAEAILIALKLSTEFALSPNPVSGTAVWQTAECNPVRCGGTQSQIARFKAGELLREAEEAEKREAKYQEYTGILKMCGIGGLR